MVEWSIFIFAAFPHTNPEFIFNSTLTLIHAQIEATYLHTALSVL